MESQNICSLCKHSMGLMISIETQTGELQDRSEDTATHEDEEPHANEPEEDLLLESADPSSMVGNKTRTLIHGAEVGVTDYAVYRNVTDEVCDIDPNMELGTAAEMCNPLNEVVVLIRSFESYSKPTNRWRKAALAGRAANRLDAIRRRKAGENGESSNVLPESDEDNEVLFGGFRRVVISDGKLSMNQVESRNELTSNFQDPQPHSPSIIVDDGSSTSYGLHSENDGTFENGVCHDPAVITKASKEQFFDETKGNGTENKDKLRRASNVLGPNRKCVQMLEEHENIDPEDDIGLLRKETGEFNVVVLTRSFETTPAPDGEMTPQERWKRAKNVTKLSKAINRLRSSMHERDANKPLCESDGNMRQFVGSGYRKISMSTVEEVVNVTRKKYSFRRRRVKSNIR